MTFPKRIWRLLTLPLGGPAGWGSLVLDGQGAGFGRVLLAALFLGLALTHLAMREVDKLLDEMPALLKDLPALELRGGKLYADPVPNGVLVLRNRAGQEVALLDLEGAARLEEREAFLQVTRTRLLVKGAEGSVEAFPLGSADQPDTKISREQLQDFLTGTARWLALALGLPFLYVLSLGLLLAEVGVVALLAIVPNFIYRTRLDGPALLRLGSAALLPATLALSLLLALGLPLRQPSLIGLGLTLVLVLRGVMALESELSRRGSSSKT